MNLYKYNILFGNERNRMNFFANGARQFKWDVLEAIRSFHADDVRMWEAEPNKEGIES